MTASVNRVAALAAAFVIAGVGAPVAAAASTPGSEYDVTFSGSASAHIVSSSHSGGDPNVETNSADQSASWKVVDNSPARLWLPTKAVERGGRPPEHRDDPARPADGARDRHRDPDRDVHAGHDRGPILVHRLVRV